MCLTECKRLCCFLLTTTFSIMRNLNEIFDACESWRSISKFIYAHNRQGGGFFSRNGSIAAIQQKRLAVFLAGSWSMRVVKAFRLCTQNFRQRVPLISSHRPCGVLTARITTLSQWLHLRTAPIDAAYKRKAPTGRAEPHASHCICAIVMSPAKIS